MEVSILNFSPRPRGNSEIAARLLAVMSREAGWTPTIIHVRKLDLKSCDGCMRCVFRHAGECRHGDDWKVLDEAFRRPRLFLIAPVYFLSPCAAWKQVQDRMLAFRQSSSEEGRFCGIVLSAGLPDWSVAAPQMSILALSAGFRVCAVRTCLGPGPGHILTSEANLEAIRVVFEAVRAGEPEFVPGKCAVCFHPLAPGVDNEPWCPACDILADGDGRTSYGSSRWHPERLRRHYDEWIASTRDLFLRDRHLIREKAADLRIWEEDD